LGALGTNLNQMNDELKDMVKNNFPDCWSRSILALELVPEQGEWHDRVFSRG
jgi:hypothetical protein